MSKLSLLLSLLLSASSPVEAPVEEVFTPPPPIEKCYQNKIPYVYVCELPDRSKITWA